MMMNNEERLREYVNTDLSYQDFKKGKGVFSDFDMFCIEHCKDIEELLEKVKQLEDDLYAANQCVNELLDVQEKNKKAREYIKHSQSYGTMAQVMPHLKPYVNGDDLLEILGDDNE